MSTSIYLAGPFFNDEQRAVVRALEERLEAAKYVVWSPSRDGTALDLKATDEEQKRVFRDNFEHIDTCDLMVAIVEPNDERLQQRAMQIYDKIQPETSPHSKSDRRAFKTALYGYEESEIAKQVMRSPQYPDIGTVWEMGYAYAAKRPVVMYAGTDLVRPNLMLAKSCFGVARTPDDLVSLIDKFMEDGETREYKGPII